VGTAHVATATAGKVILYPAPTGADLSQDYVVKANGQALDVYRADTYVQTGAPNLGGPYSFAYFDFAGSVEVEVECKVNWLGDVRIRPVSKGITPSLWHGGTIKFTLDQTPCHLSIEPEAKHAPLLLFANPVEESRPEQGDPCVQFFGPGVHDAGTVEVGSNETLYIAGGAVVEGGILARGSNIRILGRGIVDGIKYERLRGPHQNILELEHCDHVAVEGIIIKDGWGWNVNVKHCQNVSVGNLKVVASRCMNNDGIDICNSQHVTIEDSFIRSEDDCIAIKGMGRDAPHPPVDDILVTRTSLWGDRAHVWRIGCECRAEVMRNLTFRDVDVLHYVTNYWNGDDLTTCISLQPAEDMLMEKLLFEDIRINHEMQPWVIEIKPKITRWARKQTYGLVRNVTFRNITLNGPFDGQYGKIQVHGPDAEHTVRNIAFENVIRHGQRTTRESPDVEVSGHTEGIAFR